MTEIDFDSYLIFYLRSGYPSTSVSTKSSPTILITFSNSSYILSKFSFYYLHITHFFLIKSIPIRYSSS